MNYESEIVDTSLMMAGVGFLVAVVICLALYIAVSIALSNLFQLAGESRWKAWVPFINTVTMWEISGYPAWYLALQLLCTLIPGLGALLSWFLMSLLSYQFAMSYTKNKSYGILAIFVNGLSIMMLGFNKSVVYCQADKIKGKYF